MGYDGSIKFDTSIDNKGFADGIAAMDKLAKKGGQAVSGVLGSLVAKGVAAATATLSGLSAAVVKVGSDFEASMSQVAATMGTTTNKIPELTAVAKEMGATTQFSATQAADALNYLALAGYDSQKSMAALPTVLDLAAAGGMDLAYASDLVTDSMSLLGLSTDELGRFVDEMAKTSQKSNTSVAQLGEAILVAGGQAKLAGMDTIELNTALGILADSSMKGSEGGTALRNALKNLYTPTDKAAKVLKQLGVETVDSQGNLRDIQTVLQDLDSSLGQLSEGDRLNVMSQIFDTDALNAGKQLLANCGERWDELAAQITNAQGAAAEMAKTMNDNLKGDITTLGSALEGLGIQVYDHFNTPLREAAQAGTQAVGQLSRELAKPDMKRSLDAIAEGFSGLITGASNLVSNGIMLLVSGFGALADNADVLIPALAGVAAAFVAYQVISTVTTMTSACAAGFSLLEAAMIAIPGIMNAATAATAAFKAVLAAFSGPVGWIIAGVSALGVAIVGLWRQVTKKSEAEKEAVEQTKELAAAHEELLTAVEGSAQAFEETGEGIQTQMSAAEKLTERLFSVSEAEKETAAGQVRMKTYMDELNQAVPELNIALDEEGRFINAVTGEYYNNVDAVQQVIAAKKEQLLMQAAEERYVELLKEQIALEEQQAILQAKKDEIQERIEKREILEWRVKDALTELNEQYELNTEALAANATAQGELDSKYKDLIQSQQSGAEAAEEQMAAMDAQTEATSEQQGKVQELANAWGMSADAVQSALDRIGMDADEAADKVSEYADKTTDMFGTIAENTALSVDQMTANLEYNNQAVDTWSSNLGILAKRGVDEGLLAALRKAGPEARLSVENIVNASDEELAALEEAFQNSGQTAVDALLRTMGASDLAGSVNGALSTAADAAQNSTELGAAMEAQGSKAKESLDKGIESAGFDESGKKINDGIAEGVKESAEKLDAAINELIDGAYTAAENEVASAGFPAIGGAIVQGIGEGITGQQEGLFSQIRTLVYDIATEAREAGVIRSPSRLMADQVGRPLALGIWMGIDESQTEVDNMVNDWLTSMIDKFGETAIKQIGLTADSVSEMLGSAMQQCKEKVLDGFSAIKQSEELSVNDMIRNLRENQKAFEEWADLLTAAAERGVDQGFLQQFRDAGPSMNDSLRNIVRASDRQIERLNAQCAQGMTTYVNTYDTVMGQITPIVEANVGEALNVLGGMPAKAGEAVSTVGSAVSGKIQSGGGAINSAVQSTTSGAAAEYGKLPQAAATAGSGANTQLASAISGSKAQVTQAVNGVVNSASTAFNGLGEKAAAAGKTAAKNFVSAISTQLDGSPPNFVPAIAKADSNALKEKVAEVGKKVGKGLSDSVKTQLEETPPDFKTSLEAASKTAIEAANAQFAQLPVKLSAHLTTSQQNIAVWFKTVNELAALGVGTFIQTVSSGFEEVSGAIKKQLDDTSAAIRLWFDEQANTARSRMPEFTAAITDPLGYLPDEFRDIGERSVEGLWEGMDSMRGWLEGQIQEFVSETVETAREAAEVNSPSRLMARRVGGPLAEGIGVGFEDALPSLRGKIDAATNGILAGITAKTAPTGGGAAPQTVHMNPSATVNIERYYQYSERDEQRLGETVSEMLQEETQREGRVWKR